MNERLANYFNKKDWVRFQSAKSENAMHFIINKIKHKKTGATFMFCPVTQSFLHDAKVHNMQEQKEFLKAREIAFALFRDLKTLYTIELKKEK